MRVHLVMLGMLMLVLGGCAGYRGGVESSAYVDAGTAPDVLRFPGIELQVKLDNRLQTRDVQVVLFVVPVAVDLKERFISNNRPLRTRAHLTVVTHSEGFVFRPTAVRLRYSGNSYPGAIGYDFGKDDRGRYIHQPVATELVLTPKKRYLLSIDFEVPPPSPRSTDIVLELDGALESPAADIPPIHFMPTEWEQGYT